MTLSLIMFAALTLSAQDRGGRGPGAPPITNLQILPATTTFQQIIPIMENFAVSVGTQECTFCHVQGNFASDENPKKNIARGMMRMVSNLNKQFPDGQEHVGCWTCHRASNAPERNPPTKLIEDFAARAAAGRGGRGGRGAAPPPPQ